MPTLEKYGNFIREGWVDGQLRYHEDKTEKAAKKNSRLKKWGMGCFALAIAVSSVHLGFVLADFHPHGLVRLLEELLSIVAVTLPAAGAAVNGYRSLLELSRIAARSAAMAHHLKRIKNSPLPADTAGFRHYLERIEELMLKETDDWVALMEHAELEKIA